MESCDATHVEDGEVVSHFMDSMSTGSNLRGGRHRTLSALRVPVEPG